jgi:hypothetical protein
VSLSLSALGGNPVRHGVSFRYGLPAEGEVTLAVYDLSGRQVHHARATRTAGWHEHRLDVDAAQLRSGAYFVRLNTGRESRTLKFAVLR